MRDAKNCMCLYFMLMATMLVATPESLVFDLTSSAQEVSLPSWILDATFTGENSEQGIELSSETSLTLTLLRSQAPSQLTVQVAGVSDDVLLLNGLEISGEDDSAVVTLCATQQLPLQTTVTVDFSESDWATVSQLEILSQGSSVLSALTLTWESEDLPETGGDTTGTGTETEESTSSAPETVWVEATSPSRDCPESAQVAGETAVALIPSDHVTLRASSFYPFASQTFSVNATTTNTSLTSEGALRFRNSSACVLLGQPSALNFAAENPCAISAWIRPEKKDGLRNIVARGYITSPNRELFLRFRDGKLQFGWWCNSGEAAAEAEYTPTLGTWAHVMGVFNGEAYILYINGQEVARKTSNLKPVSFNGQWAIGRHPTKVQRYYYGDIAEVSFYKGTVAPEAVEILAQSRATGRTEASILGIWSSGDSRRIVLTDTTPPSLEVPTDTVSSVPQNDFSVETNGTATATDVASAQVLVTAVDETPAFVTEEDGTVRYRLTRYWLAEDAAGLETVGAQHVDLSDTVPPELTVPADIAVTQRQGIAPEVTGTATATDNSGEAPSVTWQDIADSAIGLALRWSTTESLVLSSSQTTGRLIGATTLLDETRPYTLLATFKPTSALRSSKKDHTLIAKEYQSAREAIFRVENGYYQFGFNTGSNHLVSLKIPATDVGSWVTLAGVYDGTTLRLYHNGTLVAQATPEVAPIAYEGRWALGYTPSFSHRQFLGEIAGAAMWQRPLAAREIAILSAGGETALGALEQGAEQDSLSMGLVVQHAETLSPATTGGVLLGDATLVNECQGISFSAVICPEAILQTRVGQATIISKGFVGGNEVIFRVQDGSYQFGFSKKTAQLISYTLPEEDIGQWVVLTGVMDGRTLSLYRNGDLIGQKTATLDPATYEANWAIGYSTTHEGREFQGDLRDVAIWSRPLTARECARLGTLSHEAFVALQNPADSERLRTVVREWTATDAFDNIARDTQTLTVSGAYADADSDALCDYLEMEVYGSNPDASDTDGDTLSDGEEAWQHGTNPCLVDTDGDLLPDAWELLYGFDPCQPGETYLDPDGDGLANVSEWQSGTNPLVADTDGDGLNDGLEVLSAHSDPLTEDIDIASSTQQGETTDGALFTASSGTWATEGRSVYARERSGTLTYRLQVPSPAPQVLAVKVEQHNALTTQTDFELSLKVDGIFVARFTVTAPKGAPTEALFFLPTLEAGEHTFTLAWHNWRTNSFLTVHSLRFLNFGGPDADANGIPDWQDARTSNATTVVVLPEMSYSSPICIEGTDLWRDILEIQATYPETDENGQAVTAHIPVTETIGEGFYADIPLSASGEAVTLTLEDRSLTHSFPVAWAAFDVTAGLTAEAPFPLRKGDALRLCGSTSCALTIQKATEDDDWSVVTNLVSEVAVPYTFEEAGLYRVLAEDLMGNGILGTSTVEVTESRFPQEVIATWLGKERVVECPLLAPATVLDYDAALALTASPREAGGMTLSLNAQLDRTHGMVSRLGETGPILDAAQVRPIWGDNGGYYRVLRHYADGSQLTEVVLQLGAVPEGVTVKLEIFVAGVTFEDGTRLKWLTADDFDEYGVCRLTFIRGANAKTSVCHRTYIYQNGVALGVN